MFRTTCEASWANVVSCGRSSAWRRCFATNAPTNSTTAPTTTGTNGGTNPASAAEHDAEDLREGAARLGEAVSLQQVLPREHVGHRGRLHSQGDPDARLHGEQSEDQRPGREALPSVVSEPSGASTASDTTTTTTAVTTSDHHTTRRRGKRSMNTPMNGEISVYGT